MRRVYNYNKKKVFLDLAGNLLFIGWGFLSVVISDITLLVVSIITFVTYTIMVILRFKNHSVIVDVNGVKSEGFYGGDEIRQLYWDEIETIRYWAVLRTMRLRSVSGYGISIECMIENYKEAWIDIITHARQNNPSIKISPRLLKIL